MYSEVNKEVIMGDNGIPLSIGIIIAAAVLGATFIAGMVLLAILSA
ncbi:unnamed protein product [marine sediment metagenome]|uniref:Uncharacterized protein n=1 Tax=marine sediment metagenome TaxID=412755 RepID=X1L5Z0_9ZZZZ